MAILIDQEDYIFAKVTCFIERGNMIWSGTESYDFPNGQAWRSPDCRKWTRRGGQGISQGYRLHQPLQKHERDTR